MPFNQFCLNQIVNAINFIMNNNNNCDKDDYERNYVDVYCNWGGMEFINARTYMFDTLLISEIKKYFNDLILITIKDSYNYLLKINNHYIMMSHIRSDNINYRSSNSEFVFTLLDYASDIRGFDETYY